MANYTRMKELVDFLNKHQDLYDKGQSQISDKEWDDAYFELQQLEAIAGESLPGSPTQKIRYEVVSELKKVKHEYQPMLSLDKTKDIEEIKSFIGNKEWIAMLKLDGLTCRLTYENGVLIRAETRGNGVEGEDITHNARVLSSIPQVIPYKDTLVVDGEVICDLKTFEQFKNEYANARNFAAGSIRLLDNNECAKRGLTFVAWDVITGYEDEDVRLNKKLAQLIDYNFTVVPFSIMEIIDNSNCIDWLKETNDKYTQYPIDGIVFKYNKNSDYQEAGRTDHHFRGGMAYKFYDEEYETELLNIEWSMGRTGVLTPVAIYKDIEIDGAICNRANLHNINIISELLGVQPFIGQKIWVYKANQIIPQISKAEQLEYAEELMAAAWYNSTLNPPSICPICGGETEIIESNSGTLELYCVNPQCSGKLVNKLDHFCGKKGLDIKGLSKATLEKLIDWGWVTKAIDLFYLHQYRKDWILKPGFGEKSVDKVLNAIDNARHTTVAKFISAIGIPLIGKTYASELAQVFGSYAEFSEAVAHHFDFASLEGFGEAMHDAIINFDYSEADKMHDMQLVIFDFAPVEEIEASAAIEGKIFCVTGKVTHWKNRDALKEDIEARGGKVTTSVSSKTNYLVNNDINSTSSENQKAKELNIPIITEEELIKML